MQSSIPVCHRVAVTACVRNTVTVCMRITVTACVRNTVTACVCKTVTACLALQDRKYKRTRKSLLHEEYVEGQKGGGIGQPDHGFKVAALPALKLSMFGSTA